MQKKIIADQVKINQKSSALISVTNVHIKLAESLNEKGMKKSEVPMWWFARKLNEKVQSFVFEEHFTEKELAANVLCQKQFQYFCLV